MAYYDLKHELRDGRILLYTQISAKNAVWQMRLNVRGKSGYITQSTRTTNLAEAIKIADEEYDRIQTRIREGADINDYTFEQHWKDWYERNVRAGAWKLDRQKWHQNYYERYFKNYFGERKLNNITADFMDRYWQWRLEYWQIGDGARIRELDTQRRNSKAIPSNKTLKMEQSALKQIFNDAHNMRRLTYVPQIKAKVGRVTSRRASFDEDEYILLARKLSHYVKGWAQWKDDKVHTRHKIQRQMLRVYALFVANTGLRTGEANELRWEDIEEHLHDDGISGLLIRVRETGKTGRRVVIAQRRCVDLMRIWRKHSEFTEAQDFIFYGQKRDATGRGEKHNSLNKTFQTFLRSIEYLGRDEGLLNDRDGKRRSLYSLRHVYATMRLIKGNVSIHDLALNMGTQIKQIEQHYSHVVTEQRKHEITRIVNKEKDTARRVVMEGIMKAMEEGNADLAHDLVDTLTRK